jgi:hypothetical protein
MEHVKRPFQFRLHTLLFLVTAACVYLAVDRATASTPWNDPAGSCVLWTSFVVWTFFNHRRTWRHRPSAQGN